MVWCRGACVRSAKPGVVDFTLPTTRYTLHHRTDLYKEYYNLGGRESVGDDEIADSAVGNRLRLAGSGAWQEVLRLKDGENRRYRTGKNCLD